MIMDDFEGRAEKAQTEQEKLDIVVEFLTEWHLDIFGGYPYAGMWINTTEGEKFIYASLNDAKDRNETTLEIHTKAEMLVWFEQAMEMYKQWKEEESVADISFSEALSEVA